MSLVKNSVQHPVKVVLDAPMGAHGFCRKISVFKACHEISDFRGLTVFRLPVASDHPDASEIFPFIFFFKPSQVRAEVILTLLDTTVGFLTPARKTLNPVPPAVSLIKDFSMSARISGIAMAFMPLSHSISPRS